MLLLLVHQFPSIYKTGKEIPTYKKYMCNLGQSNFNLLADHIYAKIIIILAIDINFFERQDDVVVQLVEHSLKELFYCRDVSFGHPPSIKPRNFILSKWQSYAKQLGHYAKW